VFATETFEKENDKREKEKSESGMDNL